MKETAKTQTPTSSRRKKADERMTTAEISRLREQKRIHRHTVTALIGLGLMVGGTAMYFSPHANASDEIVTYELDASQIRDVPEFTDADFAFGTTAGQSEALLMAESTSEMAPHPDFLSVSQDEATKRSEAVSESDFPEDGTYDPKILLVNMASDSTQEDALDAISDAGCVIDTMFSESDGRFGASFSVSVPDGKALIDAYKEFLANPKVYTCGFNLYLEPASVQTNDMFELDGTSDFNDGNDNVDPVSLNQMDDYSVFDDPEETYGDLNSDSFVISPEATTNFVLQATEDDAMSPDRWEYRHLKYEDIWNVTRTNGRVTVAVIDSGVYGKHLDLQNAIFNPIYVNKAGAVSMITKEECEDPVGHGTHVAGTIGATANNRFGTSGIAYNARIMPIQLETLDSNGKMSAASVIGAFNYISSANKGKVSLTAAQKANVRVVNVSLGQPSDPKTAAEFRQTISTALAMLNDSGTLVVAAAGNQTDTATVPYASIPSYQDGTPCENLISVINLEADPSDAVNGKPHRKSSSNYNLPGRRDCEISAPGTNILSTYSSSDKSFAKLTGTSQAAPIVSGTAALMFAANPDLTPAEAKQIIIETADGSIGPSAGFDEETGYGEINPVAAVQRAKSTSTIDSRMDIGKKNSTSLKNLSLQINGQSFPAFSYERIGYDLEYNDMRTSVPETNFHFSGIPTGLTLYRRIGDPEYSEERENAVNNVKYREVNQVITFLFAAKNAQLTDMNALYGIYAFYLRFNLVTGTLSAEDTSGSAANADINGIHNRASEDTALSAIQGMVLTSPYTKGLIADFDPELPFQTQYLKMENTEAVDAGVRITNLPEGWGTTITDDQDGHLEEITLTDDSEPISAYIHKYTVTVSNFLESCDYPVILWAEMTSSQAALSDSASREAQIASDPQVSSRVMNSSTIGDFDTTSERPSSYDELKGMKCLINNKPYDSFAFDQTNYIIYFKVGSTLPPQPTLTSIPTGWTLASATSTQLPKGPKYPYGGTMFTLLVAKNNLKRQYDFAYAFASDGAATTSGSAQGGGSASASQQTQKPQVTQAQATQKPQATQPQATQTPQATSQPVADKPNEVVTTYVDQSDDQQEVTTVEIGGFNSSDTQEVNAGNAPTQWKPDASATASQGTSTTASNTTQPIANTSPLSNFVAGGTLTQTGDAVVIVTGAIISGSSLVGLVLAHRRMRNVA